MKIRFSKIVNFNYFLHKTLVVFWKYCFKLQEVVRAGMCSDITQVNGALCCLSYTTHTFKLKLSTIEIQFCM